MRTETMEQRGGYSFVRFVRMPACLSYDLFGTIQVCLVFNLCLGVFAFICSCLLLLLDITLGRPAGVK